MKSLRVRCCCRPLLEPNPCRNPNPRQVASLLRDVKLECWRWTDERFTTAVDGRSSPLTSFSPLSPHPRRRPCDRPVSPLPPPSPLLHTLRYARAWTLHTLWPHDRSFWSCTRRARWWVLQLTGMVPYLGQIWWLALIAVLDRQDEYQLCNFIVGLRCAQFLTFGLGASGYACALAAASGLAAPSGGAPSRLPQLSPWGGLFWAMQLALGWRAFALLPASQKKGQRVASPEPRAARGRARRASALDARARGGVLMRLQTFDLSLASVALVLAALAALTAAAGVGTPDPRALRLSLFWIRTCHGLLCCPYLLFKLPVLDTLLTHARKTGYDELGHTVPFREVPFEPALSRRPSKCYVGGILSLRRARYRTRDTTTIYQPCRRAKSPPRTPRPPPLPSPQPSAHYHAAAETAAEAVAMAALDADVPASARASEAPPDCTEPRPAQAPDGNAGLCHGLRRRLATAMH